MKDKTGVGANIRRHRRARGLSLDQAAGLAGISKPYLSRLERGERSTDSRALLDRIAAALDVSLTDLTGQPHPSTRRENADALRGVRATRLALLDPGGPLVPDAQIAAAMDGLLELMEGCDLVRQARVVPDLLRWTQLDAARDPAVNKQRRVVFAAYAAMFLMRNLGEHDLAWMAAERMRSAAEQAEDLPTLGFAAYGQAHALAPAGAVRRATAVALAALETPMTGAEGRVCCTGR
ncbi:helix-turn-helix domain-containing protein [Krasilnikovia sp. M28-CT-15]|uniref:helix-turn-helix domain-containing protein n=1 Tax=Krasilnikovia sp. M28-CT-15 TaxID=3373540 RepID=UPI003877354D